MKKTLKNLVVSILTHQVKKLRKKHEFKVVGIVGSIGKTSTKLAIAQTLGASLRVRYQDGNYNDAVTVPLVFFGQEQPSLFNPFAWLKTFSANKREIKGEYPYDVVVLELGTDAPGQISQFGKLGRLDLVVVTSITPEHMSNFADMNAVADEETSVLSFSDNAAYNADLIATEYQNRFPADSASYGIVSADADYHLANIFHSAEGLEADVKHQQEIYLHVAHESISDMQLYSILASVISAKHFGLNTTQIREGLKLIKPVSGRLRRLKGVNNSIIIDDTYNSSPEAVKSSLKTLYEQDAPQRIAVLGSMNELGAMSADAHKQIGELCDPNKLSVVVTIGAEANQYLAPAAEAKGCDVRKFEDPYSAGEFLQAKIETGAVILTKGSQNGVFAEETVKKILADPEDASKLVRQSEKWLKFKEKQFSKK